MKKNSSPIATNPLDAVMVAAVDAMIIIDQEGRMRRINPAAQRMFGYSEDDVLGKNVKMLMPQPFRDQHDGYLNNYAKGGKAKIIGIGREVSGQRSDGIVFPIHLSVGEIRPETGSSLFVGIIRDLTEQKAAQEQVHELEEKLLHADRLVILGELTAGLAHEINQPLTAIAAYADAGKSLIARGALDSPQDIQEICKRIGEQSRRAAEVVQRLRKLVRTGTVTKASYDLNNIVRSILLLFEYELKKQQIELIFFPDESLQNLYVDEIQIQQILVNLVKNGMDAISAVGQTSGRIEIRALKAAKEVEVSVHDNGPGVPESVRRQLFEAFFTTKPMGVGLGLSICKSIAAAHGGSLSYSSPQEGGSCFTLKLPLEHIG